MPILSRGGFPQILYIDGFAGPGAYSKGEKGSPIIALETALSYEPPLRSKFEFVFVEKELDRATYLEALLEDYKLPAGWDIRVYNTTFEEAFTKEYGDYLTKNGRLPPTFAFIDPFGWKGVSFEVMRLIMAQRNCEVFVNFMFEEINRFLGHPDQVGNFDKYFGGSGWVECSQLSDPRLRNQCIRRYYGQQLLDLAQSKFVRSFEMRNQSDVTDYFLFYGTNELLGLQKMKEAMWKVDEAGDFSFSDATNPDQLVLFEKKPRFDILRTQIITQFAKSSVSVGQIRRFVLVETAFRETHFKGQILKPLEQDGLIEVLNAPLHRRKGTFPSDDLLISFL